MTRTESKVAMGPDPGGRVLRRFDGPTIPLVAIVATALAVILVKPSLSPFSLILGTQILIYCVVAVSLQLLWGRSGQLSFGQAAFFGLGVYSYAIIGTRVDSGWIALLGAIGIPLLAALALGYFLFFGGVRGSYFTITTLALQLIAGQVVTSWRSMTGGDSGLTRVPGLVLPFGAFTLDFSSRSGKYYLGLTVLVIALLIALAVRFSPFGLILEAIREDENRAVFLGYNTSGYLTAALVLSASMAGLAGGAFAATSNLAAPDVVGIVFSVEILTWVAVGGRGYLAGAVAGTVIIRVLDSQISDRLPDSWPLVIGLFFIVVVLLLPAGVVGTGMKALKTRLMQRQVA